MWISDYVTKNSFSNNDAQSGSVTASSSTSTAVSSSNDYIGIKKIVPYGIAYVPPVGSETVVLPAKGERLCLGVVAQAKNLNPGEIMLFSSGGASIVLKNDGRVLINGRAV